MSALPGVLSGTWVAVVGAGWAGCAAALAAAQRGARVTLLEAARTLGGRARRIEPSAEAPLDNGQHILIGAYTTTLSLMQTVGVDPAQALARSPLSLTFADGSGLQVPPGGPPWNVLRGVLGHTHWSWAEKLGFLRVAARWQLQGFRCEASVSVAQLCAGLPARVWAEVIEPLCVSALNTPAAQASGQVFLRVLKDALFSAPGSADLLLPRMDLSALLPDAVAQWLQGQGHRVLPGTRVSQLSHDADGWHLDTLPQEPFDALVVATPPLEAARLLDGWSPAWAAQARALRYEPITTVYAEASQPLPRPMTALRANAQRPAQYVFDRSQLLGPAGAEAPALLAFVISASADWIRDGGHAHVEQAVVAQAQAELGLMIKPLRTVTEKRATFACTPALLRPAMLPDGAPPGLAVAGDYVQGPYPATLEGAVRSGLEAARALAA
jgi:squalene-associated FAD-dependent desaturase